MSGIAQSPGAAVGGDGPGASRLDCLCALERKVLWLSSWMIHAANHLRPARDGLKVGGHQASCASLATLMTALYFDVLGPADRVAVKPHAGPVLHAILYLLGRRPRAALERFRGLGGAQAYPSRTKDGGEVDFSTGSVGLGVAMTIFASLVRDYARLKGLSPDDGPPGRMVALAGDAELDEGNVFEALLEGWKHDVRDVWWVIDYNRQSLDSVVEDRLFARIDGLFRSMGWDVRTLKYGRLLRGAFERPGGEALRRWIDNCPNSLYSALVYRGGAGWRERLRRDLGSTRGIAELLDGRDDDALHALMTNLGGHDMETVLEAFRGVASDAPTCFIAYTIKGKGLPFAGHKDNHAGLMSPEQMDAFRRSQGIAPGEEYEPFAGLDVPPGTLRAFLDSVPFAARTRGGPPAATVAVPAALEAPEGARMSTQEGFGRILSEVARAPGEFAGRVVTASPDVTVSTNLGPWVNRRGVFGRSRRADAFREEAVATAQKWEVSPAGQHIELGIAENNLFLLLAALGLSGDLFGARLLPVGTLYDPFISRGLDALNYACYQDARFVLVGTPSGLSLAPEGGAHQSVITPLIGIGQPGMTAFEPAFVDELATILAWAFRHIQEPGGGSAYLRLSTRPIAQPARELSDADRDAIVHGGYWLVPPGPGAGLAIACAGVVAAEAIEAHARILEDDPGAGLLIVTSGGRLHAGWRAASRARAGGDAAARSHAEGLLSALPPDARLVTVLDGHPATLSWLGAVARHRVVSLGVEDFGQSGDIPDLYRAYGLDADAIVAALARACLEY
ncbi:Pyruvate dehydrogenase E1 component [Aquisphaera giovannonii]|uniref:Pyruvate dehydrogenase E1 component n=1 Tax=Aquisphaera giovannonii TaxID=406548 RepID=A0A5B9VVM4_9BACT|nr:transketolase [Aquisphaera giovannonii]QEH31835.1 Pyruvate dehydrogenase E1 component [Aquisphaera giovannonii]